MLAGLREVLDPAVAAGTGVGAFNVICLEHAEALIWGAEAANLPVVLQVSENAVLYHRSLEPILTATVALARNADVPAVVHLDHVTDVDLVRAGVELGATSVMFDGSRGRTTRTSRSPPTWSGTATGTVSRWRPSSVRSAARTGCTLPPRGPIRTRRTRSSPPPGSTRSAVAVGSSHAMTERDHAPRPRPDRAAARGGRGAAGAARVLRACPTTSWSAPSRAGLTKINIGTQLNAIFTRSVRHRWTTSRDLVDPRKYLGPARDAVAAEVERLLRLLADLPDPTAP